MILLPSHQMVKGIYLMDNKKGSATALQNILLIQMHVVYNAHAIPAAKNKGGGG